MIVDLAKLKVNNCRSLSCKFFRTGNHWSSDGWDRMEDWICIYDPSNEKIIEHSVEWFDEKKITFPEWCPIKCEM